MTKLLIISIAILTLAMGSALALENIALPTGGGFYEGKVYQPRLDSATGTTATASYAPRFIGELLLGKESGSNALWVARGLTTNDWGLVSAEVGPFGDGNITDLAATKLSGNIPVARMTNGAGTLGASIGGNIPLAAITNAAVTLGSKIGGNIPIASLTNAAGGGLCIVTNLDANGKTNISTFIGTVSYP